MWVCVCICALCVCCFIFCFYNIFYHKTNVAVNMAFRDVSAISVICMCACPSVKHARAHTHTESICHILSPFYFPCVSQNIFIPVVRPDLSLGCRAEK